MSTLDNNLAPLISVLMPVYNVEKYISDAIESILSQTLKNFEFIIIDDGSIDDSKKIIIEYQKKDSRIKFISRENKGIVFTRNELLSIANAPYFAIMDSDDISYPERLSEQFSFLKNNSDYLIVGCRDLLIDPDGDPIMVINNLFEHDEIDFANLNVTTFQTLNAYMAVTEAVKGIGCYRESVVYAEDRDLFLRIAEIGKVKVLPKVLYKYRQHFVSTCVEKVDEVGMFVEQVILDAFRRRNLTPPKFEHIKTTQVKKRKDYFSAWAWFAFKSNYLSTARKYAFRLAVYEPISYNTWLLVYCLMRDYFKNIYSKSK